MAQASLKLPLDPAGITALDAKTQDGYKALGKISASKDFNKEMAQIPALVAENKDFVTSNNGNANIIFLIGGLLKKEHPAANTLSEQLAAIEKSYRNGLPAYALGYFASRMAPVLLEHDYPEEAKHYASLSVALFNEEDCELNDRFEDADRALYEQKKSKTPLKHVYYKPDGVGHCASDQAARIAVLGKVEAKLGETREAVASFNAALKIHPDMDAYVGLAKIDDAAGDKAAELRLLTSAYLTGKLDTENIAKAQALYLELNPGSTAAAYSALLDAEYAKRFSNPVKESSAPPIANRSRHTVLDEFFTGADCEPCTSPDLATEAALERYTRDELVLVVYHNNAPSQDPLTNNVGEDRAKYYSTQGSTPHTFLNGKEVDLEEGLGTHAQIAYDELAPNVDKLLATAAEGSLKAAVTAKGGSVEVTVSGKPARVKRKAHLQVLLLENPVSYSGANTLRFHPMVVRASAEDAHGARGFALPAGGEVAHKVTFDLKKIEEANFAYYEESKQALVKRMSAFITGGAFDKKDIERMGEFREHKNLIDPKHLAVVAFLQDDVTKQVLTATYVVVSSEEVAEAR